MTVNTHLSFRTPCHAASALVARFGLARRCQPNGEWRPKLPDALRSDDLEPSARADRDVTDGDERMAAITAETANKKSA